jgi:hypothetical protein
MKTSIETSRIRIGKVNLLHTAKPTAVNIKLAFDHQSAEKSMLEAERKKAEAITILRSYPRIY